MKETHHLTVARYVIVGGFLLFLALIGLLTIELRYTGRVAESGSTAYIINSTPTSCTLSLGAGYNVVSLACLSSATAITDVTNETNVSAVYQYIPTGADHWHVYNPNLPSYVVSDLTTLSRRGGYVMVMNEPATKTFDGIIAAFTTIALAEGWNLVGYPSLKTRPSADAFSSINTSFTVAVAYNKSAESYISYYNPGGTLTNISPGLGYWINATAIASWVVSS